MYCFINLLIISVLGLHSWILWILGIFMCIILYLMLKKFKNVKEKKFLIKKNLILILKFLIIYIYPNISQSIDYLLENGLDDVDESNDDEKKEKESKIDYWYFLKIGCIAGLIALWIIYYMLGGEGPSDPSGTEPKVVNFKESQGTGLTIRYDEEFNIQQSLSEYDPDPIITEVFTEFPPELPVNPVNNETTTVVLEDLDKEVSEADLSYLVKLAQNIFQKETDPTDTILENQLKQAIDEAQKNNN